MKILYLPEACVRARFVGAQSGRMRREMGQRVAPRSVSTEAHPRTDAEVMALVLSGLDLVERIARQLSRRLGAWLDYDELLSAGREGLFDAARRFEHDRGAPFHAYASVRVRGAMLDSARRMAGLPRRTYARAVHAIPLAPAADTGEPGSCSRLKTPADHRSEAAVLARAATVTILSTLTALEGSQSVIEEHFGDQELIELADAMTFATEADFSELDFRLEELGEKFIEPLRQTLESAGVALDAEPIDLTADSSEELK